AIRKILHPTDFSESSRAAFEVACSLARDHAAQLFVVHVVQLPPVFAPDGIPVSIPPEEPYQARAELARVRPVDPRVKVEHKLLEGDATVEILKAAKGEAADLIVMGTHGATGLARLLMGSVAES